VNEIECAAKAFGEGAMHTSSVFCVKTEKEFVREREREKAQFVKRAGKQTGTQFFTPLELAVRRQPLAPMWITYCNWPPISFLSIFFQGFELIEFFCQRKEIKFSMLLLFYVEKLIYIFQMN
jgi:hypothetical protein